MKDWIKIIAVIFVVMIIINFCRANFTHMSAGETYISKADKHIKIELTEEDETYSDDYGNVLKTGLYIAYLYVNDEVYEGTYHMFVSDKLKKELWVDFNDYGIYHQTVEDNPYSPLSGYFYVKRDKLVTKDTFLHRDNIFKENDTFIRKTWWNTWGKKVVIILAVLFAIWLFKDVPKMLKDKEMREFLKDDLKETFKEGVNDIAEDLKDTYNNRNNTNGS